METVGRACDHAYHASHGARRCPTVPDGARRCPTVPEKVPARWSHLTKQIFYPKHVGERRCDISCWSRHAGALLSSTGQLAAALNDEIITEAMAQRYGLTRMWVTQAQVNRGQGRLQAVVFYDGVLYAQSNRATLEAIDAETGQKLWSKMIGQPNHPSLPPGACRDLVATINGSTLFVMNRYTGDILYQTLVNGAPGGGPALSSKRAYVPMVNGMVLAYRLEPITDAAKELGKIDPHAADMSDDEKKEAAKKAEEERRENIRIRQDYIPPLACNSSGRALVPPVVTTQNRDEEFVAWVTDRGYLYVGRIDRRSEDLFVSKFRLATNGTFSNPPAYLPPDPKMLGDSGVIYAGSSDGYVYAVLERAGELAVEVRHVGSGHRFARGDRRSRLCHHRTGRHVLPQRQDRQTDLVGPGNAAFRRGREAAGVCRRQVGPPADPRCPQRRHARQPADQRHADQDQQWPDRSDLSGHGRGNHPVFARGGTDQSGRLQREPQAAAGRRSDQAAAE